MMNPLFILSILAALSSTFQCYFIKSFSRKVKCQNPNICQTGFTCVNKNNVDTCKCVHRCKYSRRTGPVCGNDGRSYQHLCDLRIRECRTRSLITVKHYGKCLGICEDEKRESESGLCKQWRDNDACENHSDYMKKFCALTCGFCKVQSPAACNLTKYGCCPGGSTDAAQGSNGEGCTKIIQNCIDRRWCKHFISDCGNNINKDTMKHYCPYTCRYCHPRQDKTRVVVIG